MNLQLEIYLSSDTSNRNSNQPSTISSEWTKTHPGIAQAGTVRYDTSEEQRGCTFEDRTLIPPRTASPPPRLTLRRRWRHRLPSHLPPPPQAQHPSVEGEAGADAEGGVPPVVRLVRPVDAPALPREGVELSARRSRKPHKQIRRVRNSQARESEVEKRDRRGGRLSSARRGLPPPRRLSGRRAR